MGLIRMMLVAVARVREQLADMDYQWAKRNAPEMAEHKLRVLHQAKRARILAAARRLQTGTVQRLLVIAHGTEKQCQAGSDTK